jgi:hypothetical protein
MKKLSLFFAIAAGLFLAAGVKAQSNADYFAGKWKITVFGTPNGDAVMFFLLDKKDGKLSGVVNDSTDKEMTKITNIEEKDSTITAYFTAQGYDVNVLLERVAADSVKGNLMNMFDAKGYRVKDSAKKP